MNSSDRLLAALDQPNDLREKTLLRIGLGIAVVTTLISLIGLWALPRGDANLVGALLGCAAALWFLFRMATFKVMWFRKFGRNFGWILVASMPSLYILHYGLTGDPLMAITGWVPAQLMVLAIAFSSVRLINWFPTVVATASALAYLSVFAWLRMHIDLEAAASDHFHWNAGFYRSGCLIAWGMMAGLLVRALRRLVVRAGETARADDLLAKYRLGERIGVGGMGEVHKATYCPEGGFVSEVAIKRVHPALARRAGIVERFRTEAEIGARLRHHNIVATLDFGRMDETYFLAMEYVDGESLRRVGRRAEQAKTTFPESIASYIGKEILAGLHFAHAVATDPAGNKLHVVHRDLCPNNVLISRAGHVKVADLGLARALGEEPSFEPSEVVGKVGYLSPEAVSGKPIDERGDLFAVGCILWELLTGEPTFKREDDAIKSLKALVACDLDSAPGRQWVPRRWLGFFSRALASNPAERFSSAKEMSEALNEIVGVPAGRCELADWLRSISQPIANQPEVRAEPSEPTSPVLVDHDIHSAETFLLDAA